MSTPIEQKTLEQSVEKLCSAFIKELHTFTDTEDCSKKEMAEIVLLATTSLTSYVICNSTSPDKYKDLVNAYYKCTLELVLKYKEKTYDNT